MTYKKGKTTRNSKKLRGSKRRYKGGDPEPGAQAGSETAAEPKTWSSWFWGTSKAVGNSTAKTAENTTLLGMFYKMIKPKKPEESKTQEETKKTEESKTQEPKESETSETNIDVQKEPPGEPPVNPDQSTQAPPVDTQSTENSKTTEEPPKTGGRRRQKRKTTKRK
jgi:hypothetical protein